MANRASAPSVQPSTTTARANPPHKDFMTEMTAKFQDVSLRPSSSLLTLYFPCRLLTFCALISSSNKDEKAKEQRRFEMAF
jgi:hypothetical protein